jgi:hypothetical protein
MRFKQWSNLQDMSSLKTTKYFHNRQFNSVEGDLLRPWSKTLWLQINRR